MTDKEMRLSFLQRLKWIRKALLSLQTRDENLLSLRSCVPRVIFSRRCLRPVHPGRDNDNECPLCHVTRLVICLCCPVSSAPGSDSSCLRRLDPPTGSEKTNDVGHLVWVTEDCFYLCAVTWPCVVWGWLRPMLSRNTSDEVTLV